MRKIDRHKTNLMNEALEIMTGPSDGSGASHYYEIKIEEESIAVDAYNVTRLEFQRGLIKEAGVNGISNEALLAILIDRLEGFQNGPFRCRENAFALTKLEEAMHWLQERTRKRVERGVEGTNEV
jgi:hypothetical protein